MHQFRIRVFRALASQAERRDSSMDVTFAEPDADVLATRNATDVRAEEEIGKEKDLLVGGNEFTISDRIA